MRIATAAELREADRQAIEDLGLPGVCLMQSAGEALARACGQAKRIAFLCGKGNNGGDGFVAARHRKLAGDDVTVFLAAPASELKGDAALHFAPLAALGIPLLPLESAELHPFELLVDCLLGTGAKGAPTGILAQAIAAANASDVPILACDLPSGVDSDTGQVPGVGKAIRAAQTLTLAALKPGLLLYPGAEYAGKVAVAPIGLPFTKESTQELTTTDWVRRVLPKRTQGRDANKGAFGKLLVLAGSRGMAGAAVLTATAALRAGVGLVYLALPESLVPVVAPMAPELVLKPLPETPEGTHGGEGALDALVGLLLTTSSTALAIGPGMSTHPAVQGLIAGLVAYPYPMVIDADGLAAIADRPDLFLAEPRPVVLTPHPGEMTRLVGRRTYHVQAERPEAVRLCAQKFSAVALLKGARTLIASPSGGLYYNREGSVALATAGSGDVLTGVIGALLAQGLSATEAARAGAYWHALAGECAEREIGKIGVLATDIRDRLPVARRWLDEGGDLDG